MHPTQYKIYQLAKEKGNLNNYTLREIAKLIKEKESPQNIKYHISQMTKKGLLKGDLSPVIAGYDNGFVNIPIYGNSY